MPATRVRRQPQRTCVACRETRDKRALTRLVAAPDGHVRLDTSGRLAGRGAYLCEQPACWERAVGRAGVLSRALRLTLTPEDRDALLAQAPAAPAAPDEAQTSTEPVTTAASGGDPR